MDVGPQVTGSDYILKATAVPTFRKITFNPAYLIIFIPCAKHDKKHPPLSPPLVSGTRAL